MTSEQRADLFLEWDLYEDSEKEAILAQYRIENQGYYTLDSLLEFLQEKLEIRGYWEKIGLS